MKCLVVIAHPDTTSLCHSLARSVVQTLIEAGHDVETEDLYRSGFPPSMTTEERRSYYAPPFDASMVQDRIERLLDAEALVLVFPTWWFGFPAILEITGSEPVIVCSLRLCSRRVLRAGICGSIASFWAPLWRRHGDEARARDTRALRT